MGCLFVIFASLFPRLAIFIIWLARPNQFDAAFNGWLIPIAGFLFLPFATLIYLVLRMTGGPLTGWEWFWVGLCAVLDVMHWFSGIASRGRRAPATM